MMIGYGFSHAGGPEVIDAIDLPTPQPGPHEIQIKTSAIGLNNRDRMARQLGGSGLTVPGYDVAGNVTALGSNVSQFKVGDRVVARTTSAYAEIVTAAADMSVLLPASITPEKGVAVITPGVTGYRMVELGNVKAGDTVIVKGASGGVGSAAIQLAVTRGASVIGIASSRHEVAVERLGVEHFVAYDQGNPVTQLRQTADVVINAAMNGLGGDDDVAMTKDNGLIVSVSHTEPLLSRGIRFIHTRPLGGSEVGKALQLLIDLMAQNKLNVQVGYVLPFTREGFVKGHQLLDDSHHEGRIVIRVTN